MAALSLLICLLLGLWPQPLPAADGIVVERNDYAYFRLPAHAAAISQQQLAGMRPASSGQQYHILQCPRLSASTTIPKPQDMPVCVVAGSYMDDAKPVRELPPPDVRSRLHTKVDYGRLKANKRPPTQSSGTGCGGKIVRPQRRKATPTRRAARDSAQRRPPKTQEDGSGEGEGESGEGESGEGEGESGEGDYESAEEDAGEDSNQGEQHTAEQDEPLDYEDYSASAEEHASERSVPLKYLGVRGVIEQLRQAPADAGDFSAESKRFFADNEEFAKGDKWRGYHGIVHRDELFNDHIFYDDGKQFGDYLNRAKVRHGQL